MQQQNGRLIVLPGPIPEMRIVRQDYLDENLPLPDRAIRNISVSPDTWRAALIETWKAVAQATLAQCGNCLFACVYPWRAALPALFAFAPKDVRRHLHIGLRRDEKQTHTTAEEYLCLPPDAFLGNQAYNQIVVADTMNATGGSLATTIECLKKLGVSPQQIIVANVIAAPEGIFNLFALFPGIRLVTAALDTHLNEFGFIQPGLGDAGDKFFDGITPEEFAAIRHCFNNIQWQLLKEKIAAANEVEPVIS